MRFFKRKGQAIAFYVKMFTFSSPGCLPFFRHINIRLLAAKYSGKQLTFFTELHLFKLTFKVIGLNVCAMSLDRQLLVRIFRIEKVNINMSEEGKHLGDEEVNIRHVAVIKQVAHSIFSINAMVQHLQ